MADKILLCISATQAIVARTRGRGIVSCEIFHSDEEGLAAFDAYVAAAGSVLALVAADTVEEDYRFETLPHATGSDRAGMLQRKLRQYYRNSPYVAAVSRGRTGDKRRDDRYLFAALTNPAILEPWLAVIHRHGLPVAGIYLLSMMTAGLVRKVGGDLSRVLVVAPHATGLRLTFYRDGEFCVSRLSRGGTGNDAARAFASEISNTRAYLSSLQLDSTDESLTVMFLDRDDSLSPVIEHVSADNPLLQCVRIDRNTLIRQLQIAPENLALALETAYLGLMAEKAPVANLAPAPVTAEHRQLLRRNAVYAASAAVAVAGMLWAGYNLWLAHDLGVETADAAKRTAAAQAQYRDITREFPAAPTTSDNLINAVEIYRKISRNIRSPYPFMQIVSRAIEPIPEVSLQELGWVYGPRDANGGNAPAAANTSTPDGTAPLTQSGTLAGEIRPFQGDYRAAIESINALAKRLTNDPAVAEVRVVKYPLNVNPGLALSGNTRDAAEHSGVAEFKITVTLKPDA